MVEAMADATPTYQFDPETKVMSLRFSDLYIVATGGVDVFALNLNRWEEAPPFYLDVEGRRFVLQPHNTHLVNGHGAQLPQWIEAEESEGRLTVLGEREGRYLVYSHDTLAVDEEDDEDVPDGEAASE